MKSKLVATSLIIILVSLTWATPEPSDLPEGMKPWWPSRYGQDDQLGTLNEITPEVTVQATKLVKTGIVVDLGRILDDNTPKFPGRYWLRRRILRLCSPISAARMR